MAVVPILLLTSPKDLHGQAVQKHLDAMDIPYFYYARDQFPIHSKLSFSLKNKAAAQLILELPEQTIDLLSLRSIWCRRPRHISTNPSQLPAIQKYVKKESEYFFNSIATLIPSESWISDPFSITKAGYKPYVLLIAHSLGFTIPQTVFGNNPSTVSSMIGQHPTLAVKSIAGTTGVLDLTWFQAMLVYFESVYRRLTNQPKEEDPNYENALSTIRTKAFSSEALSGMLSNLQDCPVIIQPLIPKKLELRITVVGEKIFAAAIDPTHNKIKNIVDIRDNPIEEIPHSVYDLPENIVNLCRALLKMLGLKYGTIDMIVTPDNEFVFLEVNPVGQWLWIEQSTGLPISKAIAELLIATNNR